MARDLSALTPCQRIERSIQKKYRDTLWGPFITGVKQYALIRPGDRICVCISGGKDSMLLAKLLQLLQRNSDFPFELRFLVMDPGYAPENRQRILDNAALLEIPVTVFDSDIFAVANGAEKNPCYLCARMRRGYLYKFARELGCNKIALGHHFSDVVETTLMGLLYGAQIQAMLPKLHSRNYPGMELIRPMYCVHEDAIIAWKNYNHLRFLQCACRFTDTCTTCNPDGAARSKRQVIKQLIAKLSEENPQVVMNIFRSVENIKLNKIISYKLDGEVHSFLDGYND